MTCANCGTPQKDNEEICLACGAKYPENNNNNKPASKMKNKKEVGVSSGVFSIFDSQNDVTSKKSVEENVIVDVLLNKKPTKVETVENIVEEFVEKVIEEPVIVNEPVVIEEVVEEQETVEEVIDEPVVIEEVVQEQETVEDVIDEPIAIEEVVEEQETVEDVIDEPVVIEEVVQEQEAIEDVIDEPVVIEEVVEEQEAIEDVIDEPVVTEEVVEKQEAIGDVIDEPVVTEEVVEVQEAIEDVIDEPVVIEEVVEEQETAEENTENILDNFISESEIDTENNVFKDSSDFNFSLSDLEELEKAIAKDKVEDFNMDFNIDDIEVFESFEDVLNSAEAVDNEENTENIIDELDNFDTTDKFEVEEVLNESNDVETDIETDIEDFDFRIEDIDNAEDVNLDEVNLDEVGFDGINLSELGLDDIDLDDLFAGINLGENDDEDDVKYINENSAVNEEDIISTDNSVFDNYDFDKELEVAEEINDELEDLAVLSEPTNFETELDDFDFRSENTEDVMDLNLDGISFDGIDLGEINLDNINLDEIQLDVDDDVNDSFEDRDISENNEISTDSTDDFIKLDGIDDIISELSIEELDDIDEFLQKNKSFESFDVEEVGIEETNIEDIGNEEVGVEEFSIEDIGNEEVDVEEFSIEDIDIEEINIEDLELAKMEESKTEKTEKNDSVFDYSLDELDNLEKMLIAEKKRSAISDIELALLSGEDVVHNYNHKETSKTNEAEEIYNSEEQNAESFENEYFAKLENDLRETVGETTIIEPINGTVSELKLDKVSKALDLKGKGKKVDFLQSNRRDFNIDDEKINEILTTVKHLKIEVESHKNEFDDQLLSFEEDLLKEVKDIEKHEKMAKAEHIENIDDIEDLDFSNFVAEDDITDTDNIVKSDVDENIQSAIDEVIQKAKQRVESAKDEIENDNLPKDGEENQSFNIEDIENEVHKNVDEKVKEFKQETKDKLVSVDSVESELLANLANEDNNLIYNLDEALESTDIDSLLLDVIGSYEQVKPKQEESKKEKPEFKPEEEEVKEFVENLESVQGFKYDVELVREYETLRLDLEFFFPNTQELEKLDKDIAKLLANGQVDEMATKVEHDLLLGDLGEFDFEELNDKDISDALLEIREMKEKEDNAKRRREERQKRLKRTRERFTKFYTYGGLFKKVDATIVHAVIVTLVVVGFAGYSTYKTESFSVNMLSRSEKIQIVEQLWDGMYDNAQTFAELQVVMQGYVDGDISDEEAIADINAYIDENYTVRQKFENVDIPTYSEYKYKIDKFLADRMLAADKAMKDIAAGKKNSNAIQELIKLKTDLESLKNTKSDFYKHMGISL